MCRAIVDAAAIPALLTGTAPPADGLTGITGAALGMERPIRWFSRLPLVDREDFEKAAAWFARYGRPAVVFSRLVPGVRSLIFLPAGADRMGLLPFSILTNAGSGIWNGLLIGLGALLGTRYELINQYSQYLDYAIYLSVAAVVAGLVIRRLRRRKRVA